MTRARTLALLLSLFALACCGLWWAWTERPVGGLSSALEPAGGAESSPLRPSLEAQEGALEVPEAERSPEVPEAALRLGPSVRSATGLPLEGLELAAAGEAWGPARLDGGRLLLASQGVPQRVRARGHLALSVEPGDEVVELQPVAALYLRGAGARERVTSVALGAGREGDLQERLALAGHWGFPDDDTWALALDPQEEWRQLRARFTLGDGSELWVEARLERGARVEVPLPAASPALERIPFEVTVRGATSPVELRVDARLRLERGRVRSADGAELASWEHLRDSQSATFESADGLFALEGFERGRSIYLRASAPAEGSEAGRSITSNGEPVVLELSGGRVLRGRLLTEGAPLPERIDLSWEFARSDGLQSKKITVERSILEGLPVDSTGRFEVGVGDDWMWEGMPLAPDRLKVAFDAPGFDLCEVTVDLSGGERVHELGTVLLVARVPELVLRAALPSSARHGASSVLCSPRAPLVRHWVDCLLASERAGAPVTEVYLQKLLDEDGGARFEVGRLRYSWTPLEDFAPAALVALVEAGAYPFERTADGTYSPVSTGPRKVELELATVPEGATRLELAWSWRGLVVPLSVGGTEVLSSLETGEVLSLELDVPAEGVELLAQFSRRRENDGAVQLFGDRHRLALSAGELRLTLP